MACSTTCPTPGAHRSWGECVRSKGIKTHVETPGTGYDPAKNKAWDKRIDSYKSAREQGIQPKSTRTGDIQTAVRVSDSTGSAFSAE